MEQFIKNLAKGAGAILRDGFTKKIQINHKKGFWDVVTQYDLASDKFIQERIKKRFPSHGILSEEGTDIKNKKHLWIIDPLDGTRNFSRGIPIFNVSISYVKGNRLELGAVYDPMRDELFFAKRNVGSFLNGKRTQVNELEMIEHALCSTEWVQMNTPISTARKIQKMVLKEELWNVQLASGALALAYVGAGRYDFAVYSGAWPWDYSAASLICQEAGAKVTDFKGRPYKWNFDQVLASHPRVHAKILKYLK